MGQRTARSAIVMLGVWAVIVGCSGKDKDAGGAASGGIPSGIVPAAPRALGPGAASMDLPSKSPEPTLGDDDEDPFMPFADGGLGAPNEPLPL